MRAEALAGPGRIKLGGLYNCFHGNGWKKTCTGIKPKLLLVRKVVQFSGMVPILKHERTFGTLPFGGATLESRSQNRFGGGWANSSGQLNVPYNCFCKREELGRDFIGKPWLSAV